jgi:hypothetical protein
MNIRRSAGSPFGTVIFLKPHEVDKMCVDALRVAKLLPDEPAPIDIEALIENYFKARLDFGTDLGSEVLGFTFFSDKGKPEVVGISPKLDEGTQVSERRIRATLAHEAGHAMIHPILFMTEGEQPELMGKNVDLVQRRILCRNGDINPRAGWDGRWWELQANYCIGGFLLPKQLVAKCVDHLLTTSGLLGGQYLEGAAREDAVQLVSEKFSVNPIVAKIRLGSLFPENVQEEL